MDMDSRDYRNAYENLYGGYVTPAGYEIASGIESYFENYRDAFLQCLEDEFHEQLPDRIAALLCGADRFDGVGDFIDDKTELATFAAFGLVLLDRLALTGWGKLEPANCFYWHEQIFECWEAVRDRAKAKAHARQAARKRMEPYAEARAFVQAEWVAKAAAYEHNKSAFARDYSRLVPQRFSKADGDPLPVTEKQIRDVWLSDSRPASKPAGKPAGG